MVCQTYHLRTLWWLCLSKRAERRLPRHATAVGALICFVACVYSAACASESYLFLFSSLLFSSLLFSSLLLSSPLLVCVYMLSPHPFALCGLAHSSSSSSLSSSPSSRYTHRHTHTHSRAGKRREKEKKSFAVLGWEPVSRRLVSRRVIQQVDSCAIASRWLNCYSDYFISLSQVIGLSLTPCFLATSFGIHLFFIFKNNFWNNF